MRIAFLGAFACAGALAFAREAHASVNGLVLIGTLTPSIDNGTRPAVALVKGIEGTASARAVKVGDCFAAARQPSLSVCVVKVAPLALTLAEGRREFTLVYDRDRRPEAETRPGGEPSVEPRHATVDDPQVKDALARDRRGEATPEDLELARSVIVTSGNATSP